MFGRSSVMMINGFGILCCFVFLTIATTRTECANIVEFNITRDDAADADAYLGTANEELRKQKNVIGLASWEQSSNITPENDAAYIKASAAYDVFAKKQFDEVKSKFFATMPTLPAHSRRQLEKMGNIGTSALNPEDSTRFSEVSLRMKEVYSTASITAGGKPDLELEPELTDILATSTDESLLREVWLKWRDATGPKMRADYITYYELGNKAAKANQLPGKEFETYDDLWMAEWETPDMKQQVDALMTETAEIYKKIHAYIRFHLKKKYGDSVLPADGTIPAHLLGNMWAQSWSNILNTIPETNPYPDVDSIDTKVNKKLAEYKVDDMFKLAETFFAGLGMEKMTEKFWSKSILEKPTDRNLTCHASAWDFYSNEGDFRIKQCTEKNINDLITIHHEMGHIQYYMNYETQPPIYRRGANPGFHEAIGDLIALSVATPQHLTKIALLDAETTENLEKINLNYQMKMALDKIAFLPFSYVMDKWRWDVFANSSLESQLNKHWWQLSLQHQGISPPITDRKRNEIDFDPGAKYHIPAGVEYVRYFASHILQFQFYEKMCSFQANQTDADLYKCDFDGNVDAGKALMATLAKGSSDVWTTILQDFIGSPKMSLSSLKKYFQPLITYLDKFIADNNIEVGWKVNVDDYVDQTNEDTFLELANNQFATQSNALVEADWAQGSNISAANEAALVVANEIYNKFRQNQSAEVKTWNFTNLEPSKRRQFEKFAVIGTSALNDNDTTAFQSARLRMEAVYSTAKVSAGNETGLELEPDLTQILATKTNESLLREVWVNFRDATGPKMRADYITYYKLGNKAAKENELPGGSPKFETFDDLWMFSWEAPDLKDQIDKLMKEIENLYQSVHAYVRFHLEKKYPTAMPKDGTIPAHLLGNMWAQQWSNILNIIPEVNPYPDVDPIDAKVNEKLSDWSINQMYKLSEKFFADLGMENMTSVFWDKSILEKPEDRNMTCHASAWDFYAPPDFRIKQCTEKTINHLTTVHHEMGHIQYFMNYAQQPAVYREGANPGFHEAIGDLIALSVATPTHLAKVQLLDPITNQTEAEKINLNYQMKMALDKIAFLPFSYVMDKWRWDVFANSSLESQLNKHWWQLSLQHQGISPPITDRKRNEIDFDPGAKYHIPAGVEYVRYFASHVLQFQFFEKMCATYLQTPGSQLYQCDFDGDKTAGAQLIEMLKKGSSDTWQNILKDFIGNETMSLSSLNKYFEPLKQYLDKFIADNKIKVGWNATVDDYVDDNDEDNVDSGASSHPIGLFSILLILFSSFALFFKR